MSRNGVLYKAECGHGRDDCGELFNVLVEVTQEANGFAVWSGLNRGGGPSQWHYGRDRAIEAAVDLAQKLRGLPKQGGLIVDEMSAEEIPS